MCQCMENHIPCLLVQIHLIYWVHVIRLELEGGSLVICDHLGVWYLRLEEGHVHRTLFCVKCRQQPMMRSQRLLSKLSVSIAGKGLILFLNQLVLLENDELGPSLS